MTSRRQPRTLLAAAAACLTVATFLPRPLPAQRIELELSGARRWADMPLAEHRVTAALTLRQTGLRVLFEHGRLLLVSDDARRVPLPTRHTTLLFADGRGVLQYATSPLDGSTEILWLGVDGTTRQRVDIALGLLPLVAVGSDGSSLFAGSGTPPAESNLGRGGHDLRSDRLMAAFSPAGDMSWQRPIDPARAVVLVAIASGGEPSVAVTADRADPLAEHQIEVFGRGGEPAGVVGWDATVQRLALVPGQRLLWAQTVRGNAMFELGPGPDLRWRRDERRCAGSAASVAADARAQHLFVIDRDCSDDHPFRWRLSILAIADGSLLQVSPLDEAWRQANPESETAPIAPRHSDWIQVDGGEVRAAVGDYLFEWRWRATE